MRESSKQYSEYLVIYDCEMIPIFDPNKVSETLLACYYFVGTLQVVSHRKHTARVGVRIAIIGNA